MLNYCEFGPAVQNILFKDLFLYLAMVAILFSGVKTFQQFREREHYEKHLGDIIFNLDQLFRIRCCFLDISMF